MAVAVCPGDQESDAVQRTGVWVGGYRLCSNSNCVFGLAGSERDDASDGIVGRDANGHAIAGHDFDAKSPHPPAQLGQYFVARIDLHPVKTAAVNGYHGALDINKVVLAQIR